MGQLFGDFRCFVNRVDRRLYGPESGYSLIGTIFWWILFSVFCVQLHGLVCYGFVQFYMSSAYLKYKYREVNEKIALSLKYRSHRMLMRAIDEHHLVTQMSVKFNNFYKYLLFDIYYMSTPGFELLVYIIFAQDTPLLASIAFGFIFCLLFGMAFSINLVCTWVSTYAHRSRSTFYSYVNSMGRNIPFHLRLKIVVFIERLSANDIGIYCYDMFLMNNYEFSQYILNFMANHFLVLNE